jgi:hypothetical protein
LEPLPAAFEKSDPYNADSSGRVNTLLNMWQMVFVWYEYRHLKDLADRLLEIDKQHEGIGTNDTAAVLSKIEDVARQKPKKGPP